MAKFTSGPWMQKKHDGAGRTFELKREFWEVGGGPDKAGVAFVFKGQANANLIAAAPELYYALKCMIDDLPSKRDWLDPVTEAIAKQALAKADGTENGE